MDKLKKTSIEQGAQKCPTAHTHSCPDNGPFFNPDYFGHVVVQTLEELNSIPCKLRQDGMVATIVQDNYSEWQIQSSRTGFGICDNQVWVKVSAGDIVYDGGNLFIFDTEQDADSYISNSPTTKQGQMLYITELDNYYKFDGQDGYTDPFPNKLEVPTTQGTDETLEYKIPTYVNGKPYWRNATDFGKVDSVNNKRPDDNKNVNIDIDDVLSKGMPTSETTDENKKVLLYDDTGKSYWKSLSEVGKVKTVNNQEPDESGNIALPEQQFVKNGEGWSLKYKVDNPTKYEPTGENAVDLTKAYPDSLVNFGASGKNSFAVGAYNLAKGNNSISIGYNTKAYGNGSHVYGYTSTVYSGFATIIGGSHNEIGTESEITTPVASLNTRAIIVGGQNNKIINGNRGTIVGGASNTITAGSSYNSTTRPYLYNAIFGGYENQISDATTSTILGGRSNKVVGHSTEEVHGVIVTGGYNTGKGSYSSVFGYKNTSITQGEFIVGLYSTVQDTNLLPSTYYSGSRMFNVGVGNSTTEGAEIRKDGLSVFQNGLVTVPSITNTLIENNAKAITTKEFVDNKVSNFPLPTHWTNAQQRMSALPDKSTDATYNNFMLLDSTGNLAKASNAYNALLNSFSTMNAAQRLEIMKVMNGSSFSTGAITTSFILMPIINKLTEGITTVKVLGTNLLINPETSYVRIKEKTNKSNQVECTFVNNNSTELLVNIPNYFLEIGKHYILEIKHGLQVHETVEYITCVGNLVNKDISATTWQVSEISTIAEPNYTSPQIIPEGYNIRVKRNGVRPEDLTSVTTSLASSKLFDQYENFILEISVDLAVNYSMPNNFIGVGYSSKDISLNNNSINFVRALGVYSGSPTWGADIYRHSTNLGRHGDGLHTFNIIFIKRNNELITYMQGGISKNIIVDNDGYRLNINLSQTRGIFNEVVYLQINSAVTF